MKATARNQTISEPMAVALIQIYQASARLGDVTHTGGMKPEHLKWLELRELVTHIPKQEMVGLTKLGWDFVEDQTRVQKYREVRPTKEPRSWGPMIGIRECLSGRYDYDRMMAEEVA